jgi:hypothetical protein
MFVIKSQLVFVYNTDKPSGCVLISVLVIADTKLVLGTTVTLTVAVFVQPAAVEPVTVYVELLLGCTVQLLVLGPPDQLYVAAPLPLTTEVFPKQILVAEAVALTVGSSLPVTSMLAVFVQPLPSVPVTVYVVVPFVAVNAVPLLMLPLQL